MRLDQKCIKITGRGVVTLKTKVRYLAINDVSIEEGKEGEFRLAADGLKNIRKLKSSSRTEIVEEIAARCRFLERMLELLDCDEDGEDGSAEDSARDEFGQTALHQACSDGNVEAVRQLLQDDEDVNAIDKYGNTPLHTAIRAGQYGVALELAEHTDISVNMLNNDGMSALHFLCKGSSSGENDTIDRGQSLLHTRRVLGCFEMLAERGMNMNLVQKDGQSPLHIAVERKNGTILRLLLEGGADPDVQDKEGNTPLHLAISSTNDEAVMTLLVQGADKHIINKAGTSCLALAYTKDKVLFQVLCECECTDEWPNASNPDALHEAIIQRRLDRVYSVVRRRFRGRELMSHTTADGSSPLHTAAMHGHLDAFRVLLAAPEMNCKAQNEHGETPLHVLVSLQLSLRTSVPHIASRRRRQYERALDGLCEKGCAVWHPNAEGNTAFHCAALASNTDAMRWLLRSGQAHVDTPNNVGETALHVAVRNKDEEMVSLLVEFGASPQYSSPQQQHGTPQQLAHFLNVAHLLDSQSTATVEEKSATTTPAERSAAEPSAGGLLSQYQTDRKKRRMARKMQGKTVVFSRKSMHGLVFEDGGSDGAEPQLGRVNAKQSLQVRRSPARAGRRARIIPNPASKLKPVVSTSAEKADDEGVRRRRAERGGVMMKSDIESHAAFTTLREIAEQLTKDRINSKCDAHAEGDLDITVSGNGVVVDATVPAGVDKSEFIRVVNAVLAKQREHASTVCQEKLKESLRGDVLELLSLYSLSTGT